MFSHQFSRFSPDPDVKRQLAEIRAIEQQQQKAVNWLLPGTASVLETTIEYEQVAVDLTAWVARSEPNPYLRQAYEFGGLEDFDHLYRYSNLYEMIEHRAAEKLVDRLTEVMPGRPTRFHHRHPVDNVRDPYDRTTVDPISRLHALTIMSAEQQTMNFYMHGADRPTALPGDRADRGGARHPLRVAGGPRGDVGRAPGGARVQRVLPVPLLPGAGVRSPGEGDLGAAPEHGAGAPARRR